MALDRNYFNSIVLDPVRKKYYPVKAVDDLLVDIRSQATGMLQEAEAVSARANSAELQADALRKENAELRANAETLSREISSLHAEIDELKLSNESLLAVQQQSKQQQRISRSLPFSEERAALLSRVERFYVSAREVHTNAISRLDEEWQSLSAEAAEKSAEDIPEDLSQRVMSIARELEEIESLR